MPNPTTRSGHCESTTHTPNAANRTEILAMMSLREHNHTERMLTSSVRCRDKRTRQQPLVTSASNPIRPIISNCGVIGCRSFQAAWHRTNRPNAAMMPLFKNADADFHASLRVTTYRLNPYTNVSPSISRESASSAVDAARIPMVNSIRNMTALIPSTIFSVRDCVAWSFSMAHAVSVQQSLISKYPRPISLPSGPFTPSLHILDAMRSLPAMH